MKKFLSCILTLCIALSTISPLSVHSSTTAQAYQGIFMKDNTFIALLLYTYVEPGDPIGIIYHISRPHVGDYGAIKYDHYQDIGEIYQNGNAYFIKGNLYSANLTFNEKSVTISNLSPYYDKFQGTFIQVSNSGANMPADMMWLDIPQAEKQEISILLDNIEIPFDQPPIMENDRVMVPMRAIFEALGYEVDWYDTTKTAVAHKESSTITVQLNNPKIIYNENTYTCDVYPNIINGRTLVPVRAIAECADCNVEWDGANKTVIITSYR